MMNLFTLSTQRSGHMPKVSKLPSTLTGNVVSGHGAGGGAGEHDPSGSPRSNTDRPAHTDSGKLPVLFLQSWPLRSRYGLTLWCLQLLATEEVAPRSARTQVSTEPHKGTSFASLIAACNVQALWEDRAARSSPGWINIDKPTENFSWKNDDTPACDGKCAFRDKVFTVDDWDKMCIQHCGDIDSMLAEVSLRQRRGARAASARSGQDAQLLAEGARLLSQVEYREDLGFSPGQVLEEAQAAPPQPGRPSRQLAPKRFHRCEDSHCKQEELVRRLYWPSTPEGPEGGFGVGGSGLTLWTRLAWQACTEAEQEQRREGGGRGREGE